MEVFSRRILEDTVRIDKVVVELSGIDTKDRACSSDPVVRVLDRTRPGSVDEFYVVVVEVLVFNRKRIR